jgi:hypothetical protein
VVSAERGTVAKLAFVAVLFALAASAADTARADPPIPPPPGCRTVAACHGFPPLCEASAYCWDGSADIGEARPLVRGSFVHLAV